MKHVNRWFYAGVGMMIYLLIGMVYAWSVLSSPIAQEFPQWSKAELSTTFTIVMLMFCVGCMASGYLAGKVSARVCVWIGAGLFLAGFFGAARMYSLLSLYLSFGVLCGFACGFSYTAILGTLGKWFPDKQGTFSGVLMMSFGLSSFLVGKVYQAVTPETIGAWRGTFQSMGVIIAAVMVVCGFFVVKPGADFQPPAPAQKKKKFVNPVATELNTRQMLRTPTFWIYYSWVVVISAAGLALLSQASPMAREVGPEVAAGTIVTVAGLISIFNGVGRVFFGRMFDLVGRGMVMQMSNIMFILAGAILVAALSTHNFSLLVAGYVIGGFGNGCVAPTNSAFISSYFGMKNFSMNFSVINTNLVISSFGSTVAGALFDMTQSYVATCLMLCVLGVLGIGASLAIGVCDRRTLAKMQKN